MAQVAGEAVVPELRAGTPTTPPEPAGRPWPTLWRRFRRRRAPVTGLVVIAIIGLLALAAPVVAQVTGHGPEDVFPRQTLNPRGLPIGPSAAFWFGADGAGGDVFVRVLYGARTSLAVGLLSTGLSLAIGTVLGLLAGFYRGAVDTVVSRLVDVVLSLPILLLAVGLAATCGVGRGCLGGAVRPGILLVSAIIGLFGWPYIARIVRGQSLSLRERAFVEAARAQGAGDVRIMLREILPNLAAPILAYATLLVPTNILFEAALSFLGVGTSAATPSWGRMLSEAGGIFTHAWWMMLFPGLFLFVTALAFNLIGDGLRDALDPRSSGRAGRGVMVGRAA